MSKKPNRASDKPASRPDTGHVPARTGAPPPTDQRPPEDVEPAHREMVEAGMADARAGRFAADDVVDALYRRAGS